MTKCFLVHCSFLLMDPAPFSDKDTEKLYQSRVLTVPVVPYRI